MLPPPGTTSIQNLSKELINKGFKTGPRLLFRQLRRHKILNSANVPFTEYVKNGWFYIKRGTYRKTEDSEPEIYYRTFVTAKGILAIEKLLAVKPVNKSYVLQLNIPDCVLGF